jgi:hypothetical protein
MSAGPTLPDLQQLLDQLYDEVVAGVRPMAADLAPVVARMTDADEIAAAIRTYLAPTIARLEQIERLLDPDPAAMPSHAEH